MKKKPARYKVEPYYSKHGPIPDDHWESELGPPKPLESFMSPEAIEEFRAETAKLRAEADKLAKDEADKLAKKDQ
jgi:hypothetical protein